MSVIRVIVSTFISSLIVFDAVRAGDPEFSVGQYYGKWYTICTTLETDPAGGISCDWTVVSKRDDGEWTFDEVERATISGEVQEIKGYGKVSNGEIETIYPDHNWSDTFTVTVYNNGKELILHKKDNENHHILVSHNTTASAEAMAVMEKYAADTNYHAVHISHDGCFYNNDN